MKNKPISVTTKTGDLGTTGLANGQRLPKDAPVFQVVGDLDELNSWLGLIASKFEKQFENHQKFIYEIQDTLFYIGAELAGSKKASFDNKFLKKLELKSQQIQDTMAEGWHKKFLLPGGTELGGLIDVSRTVCRRAERSLVAYSKIQPTREILIKYLNRLSDYLYVLRCFINHAVEYKEKQFQADRRPIN